MTSWTVWYMQAILHMARTEAKGTLARLLTEPEYEQDAAWGLFQLARTDAPSSMVWPRNWSMRAKNFDFVWRAKAGETEVRFVEPLRAEVSASSARCAAWTMLGAPAGRVAVDAAVPCTTSAGRCEQRISAPSHRAIAICST